MIVPDHIRKLAEDASTAGQSVLADWFEEQGDLDTAARLREGGVSAQVALLCIFGGSNGSSNDAVIVNGSLMFQWCTVDLSMRVERPRSYDGRRHSRLEAHTTAFAKVVGRPLLPVELDHEWEEVSFLTRDQLVVVRPHSWSSQQDTRQEGVVRLDIEGYVISHEIVNRVAGTVTQLGRDG